jgi:hypothetical protein
MEWYNKRYEPTPATRKSRPFGRDFFMPWLRYNFAPSYFDTNSQRLITQYDGAKSLSLTASTIHHRPSYPPTESSVRPSDFARNESSVRPSHFARNESSVRPSDPLASGLYRGQRIVPRPEDCTEASGCGE